MSGEGIPHTRRYAMTNWTDNMEEYFDIISAKEIYCKSCSKVIKCRQKSDFTRHVNTTIHKESLNAPPSAEVRMNEALLLKEELYLPAAVEERRIEAQLFNEELCEAFLVANIPLLKLRNAALKKFLQKYTQKHIPHESTLRKYYVSKLYRKVMDQIKINLSGQYVWISADETVDILGRCVVNVVVGILSKNVPYTPYLISSKVSSQVDADSMTTIITEALDTVLVSDKQRDKVLLFVSDAAAYMLKTGELLKALYPNIMHVTCIAHALHRICEYIRDEFPNVEKLMVAFEKILSKAPLAVALYREKWPFKPLPPTSVNTRCGSWIGASVFYCQNFYSLKHFVSLLPDDAPNIVECKKVMHMPDLMHELQFIKTHFQGLGTAIQYFEGRNIKLADALSILDDVFVKLKDVSGEFGDRLGQKIDDIFHRNSDFQTLQQLFIGTGEDVCDQNVREKYTALLPNFTYAPLTSCDVERTFSVFNDILTSQRTYFTEEHLEKTLLVNVNSPVLSQS